MRTARQSVVAVATVAAIVMGALAVAPPAAGDQNDAPTRTAFRALSAGNAMTCAITDAGVLKCWGQNNTDGALGLGDNNNRGDQPDEMGDALPAVPLGTGRSAVAVSSGGDHSCVLLDDASVKCFGWNGGGQLGLGDFSARGDQPGELGDALPAVDLGTGRTAVAVSANGSQSCAILDNAQLKCWGDNNSGQLGQGDTVRRGNDPGEMGDALLPVDLGTGRTAVAVAAGRVHTCALLDNGQVKCWGSNQFGQLGLGDTNNRGDGPMGDALPAVDLGTGRTAVAISAGFSATCALLDNGQVKCWGSNSFGQLGLGDTASRGDGPDEMGDALPPVDLGTGRTAVAISAGDAGACALLDNGQVKCWGLNFTGQLGQGDTENRGDGPDEMGDALPPVDLGTGRTAVAIAAGNTHNCARLDDGVVKCWGSNNSGGLGLGDTANRGDGPGEMGDALPATAVVTPGPPTIDLRTPPDGTTYRQGAVVAADYACAGGGGVATCTGTGTGNVTVADGDPIDTSTAGYHTFTVDALDHAGNTATLTHHYTVALARPDGRIQRGTGRLRGNDIYGTFTRQTVTGTALVGGTVTYVASIQNDAPFDDALRLRGQRSTGRFTVTYRDPTGADITATVRNGTYTTPTLAPGATHRIRITVTVRRSAPTGAGLARTLTATSTVHPAQTDSVRFLTLRR